MLSAAGQRGKMMFKIVDMKDWNRRERYEHYTNNVVCTYSISTEINITPLEGYKLYPIMLWLLTGAVNSHEQFRTCLTKDGVGIFDAMNPSYTVFNRESESFSVIWTEYSEDYQVFLERYERDIKDYSKSTEFMPKRGKPANYIRCVNDSVNIIYGI